MNWTRTPYLALFVILIAIGISSAYAITITLGGDPVIINGILDMMGNKITNVGTPTLATDAATKGYVDSGSPGSGTVTSVGTGTGLTGGPITSTGTISIDTAVVPQLGASSNFFSNDMTVDGNLLVAEGSFTVNQAANIGSNLNVDGDIDVSGTSPTDDDIIRFDSGGATLRWSEGQTRFVFNSPLDVVGSLAVTEGGSVTVGGNLVVGGTVIENPWNSRVPQSTSFTTVDTTGIVGFYTSITIGTDGLPVVSYYNSTGGDLKVAHCTNTSCSTFDTPITVDSSSDVGEYTSITIGTDGFPIISYYNSTGGDLKVAHCTNTSCSTFDTPITVDSFSDVGRYTSITIGTDGFPIISYYDVSSQDLRIAHCTNVSCTSSNAPSLAVDSTDDVGQYTSIAIGTDGLPVISYYDVTNTALKVVHCTNADCQSFDTPVTVDNSASVGQHTSITIGTDSLPVVSYYDELPNRDLKVAHCTNISCSTSTTTTVDSIGDVGDWTSITIGTDGLPVISYNDNANFFLKFVHCTNASCSSSDTPVIVNSGCCFGAFTSITIGTDGLPVISYLDSNISDLKVAKCTNPYCIDNWIRR